MISEQDTFDTVVTYLRKKQHSVIKNAKNHNLSLLKELKLIADGVANNDEWKNLENKLNTLAKKWNLQYFKSN